MREKHTIILAMTLCIIAFPYDCGAEAIHLRINCTIHSPSEAFFFGLVEEICSRNHITVERNTPPVGRSLIHANRGIDDGDGPRIGGLSSKYPDLVCIPEPFGNFVFGAFAKVKNIKIDGWSSLSGLNVAYIHGWKIFDSQVTAAKSVTKVKNKELLFRLLNAGRTDVVLITKLAGYATIRKLALEEIRFVEPPLAIEPSFLYLHKRHKALVPKLAQTLKILKQDGTYAHLYHEMVFRFLPHQ